MLTPDDVKNIAILARIELSEEEIQKYTKDLTVILDYIKMLEEVNTDGIPETCQVTGLMNVMREDELDESTDDTKKKIIANFPDKIGNLLKVKKVFH